MALVLRDIHQPPAPPWWPPAPGWWLLFALVVVVASVAWAWHARRKRRRREIEALFDDTVARADSPARAVAAMSELLRRAARRHDPRADRLQGAEWLALLGARLPPGDAEALAPGHASGRLLLEGAFRTDVGPGDVDALHPVARKVYLAMMSGGKR
ncbi:MAG TPA: DUF4381 family protein [Xanthomonadaceae bacterium]|nr:DUF4381 family protein [Xanthomonadaceae bacterium]